MTDGVAGVALRPVEGASDRQLLKRFVSERDEAAFALLVRRHGPAVLRTCRRVLRDEHAAEDVSQAAFLVLARKAANVRWRNSVGPWLNAVAYRLARHAASAIGRRRELIGAPAPTDDAASVDEPEALNVDPLVELTRTELRRVVADEVQSLPAKYRLPMVLCYFEGKTNEEAARELGWPAGSMSRRLSRARALLRQGLTRRGLALMLIVACAVLTVVRSADRGVSAAAHAAPNLERRLERFASGVHRESNDEISLLVRQAAIVADQLDRHTPDRDSQTWRGLSKLTRQATLDLASAVAVHDDPAALAAAGRLAASCQKCHTVYRQ